MPMMALSQRIERSLNGAFLLIEQLTQTDATASSVSLEKGLAMKIDEVIELLDDLKDLGIPSPLVVRLEGQLQALQRATAATLLSHREMRLIDTQIAAALDRAEQLQEQSHLIIDDLAYQLSTRTEALLSEADVNRASVNNALAELSSDFSDLMLNARTLNDIRLSIDALNNIIINQGLQEKPLRLERAKLLVNEHLQNAITRLPHIAEMDARQSLARQIAALRDDLLDPLNGFFVHTAARLRFRDSFNALQAEHLPMIVELSNLSSDLTQSTLQFVDRATDNLSNTIHRVIWIVGLTVIFALIAIVLTNGLVIERQFNRRIQRLTNSVTAIAKGDLDHPITVCGRDELGEMARALVVFRRTAEELRRSNIELEKFAYVAAHDLRSPLRAVHELSLWVLEDDENALSEESREYLLMAQQRIDRLNRLLNDLLDYARAGQDHPVPEPVNIGQLVSDQARFIDTKGRFKITFSGTDQPIDVQLSPLQQILGNLISNAIKHHDRGHGTIHVNAKIASDRLILTVQDDGPGIELRHQEKIFELFQTLKSRDEVEGSGLGLAIVSKLAIHQKGKVSLISNPDKGRGSAFVVELPQVPPSQRPAPPLAAAA
ncbi:Phytochrome-like protein cph1 [Sulfitobacter sp. DSM 110093]|uniref:sensor histidine kinase n=1 Tax=Sulfitobacter sp. DSM 110093 TaxID=2883127 RepID=UPI001FAE1645|nr:ATP-binding protein [Sulfitobacter sp. DSM 110093]UOA30995.1 Phytochrome-like protein cph1 [Sulfitobacter sp. DSM 110093]